MTAVETLRTIPLFAQCRDDELEQLSHAFTSRDYPKNSVILSAHDPGDTFYVLLKGQVKVMIVAEDGREVILTLMRNGDFFGESSLFKKDSHGASVVTMQDSRLLVLRRDDLYRFLMSMPGVALGLLRALCARVQAAGETIGGLVLLDVTGRVSRLLLQLAEEAGSDEIKEAPTHQIIAQIVGSSRETVSRTIGELAARQWITTSRDGIALRDRDALIVAAGQRWKQQSRRRDDEDDARQARRREPE
jgi:CRP/FNR family transcriptional regulator, cyclic AMP receptor protein